MNKNSLEERSIQSSMKPDFFLPEEDGRFGCIHINCSAYLTLEVLQNHIITSKARDGANGHGWLARLMDDTTCPIRGCDFKGEDLKGMFSHMLKEHEWHWENRKKHIYSDMFTGTQFSLLNKDGKLRCVANWCGTYDTWEDLRKHITTSKAKEPAKIHEWLANIMKDTSCPLPDCAIVGGDYKEMFVHMSEKHGWNWTNRELFSYSTEPMLKHVPSYVSQGKIPNIELSVPPKFDYHSSPPFGPPLLATISSQSRPTVRAPHTTWGSQQASYHGPAKAVPIPHAGSDSNPQKNRLQNDDSHLPYERPGPVRRLDRSHTSEILNNADNRFREDSWQRDEPFYQKNDSSSESVDEVAFRRMSQRKP